MNPRIEFTKITPGGRALGYNDGKVTFCVGPIPGEQAEIKITKQHRRFDHAEAIRILKPSPHRHDPREEHFMSCSPWQGIDYSHQLELKRSMLADALEQHHLSLEIETIKPSPQTEGYRNRIDFTLHGEPGSLRLAFHRRGSWEELVDAPSGCMLAAPAINLAASTLVEQFNQHRLPLAGEILTLRYSHHRHHTLAILATNHQGFNWKSLLPPTGGTVAVARRLRGSGGPGELLYASGPAYLEEVVHGSRIAYPYDAFFQTNVAAFECALDDIIAHITPTATVAELYSGVGTIGLPVARIARRVTGVEVVGSASEFAARNAQALGLSNYVELSSPAEQMEFSLLEDCDVVVVDPPRAGLHPRVIRRLQRYLPETIIYLSCNPVTQARDMSLLKEVYAAEAITGYDFYPGALHLETLAILRRR